MEEPFDDAHHHFSSDDPPEAQGLRDYLDERINLGKAAELLQVSRSNSKTNFLRVGISPPPRGGPRSIEDALANDRCRHD